MFTMRPSRVLAKLRAGEIVNCVKLNINDPRVVEIAARCGLDCVWLDLEHVPNTLHDVENQVRAAKAYDTDALVRVTRGSYSDLVLPLHMDAAGLMVPHVMSAEDARNIVRNTKFHPIGRRPFDDGNSDGGYCNMPIEEYLESANRERFIFLQIEDPEAMEEIDEIASIEGVDGIFFGPGDYSHALGVPGQGNHPEVVKARKRVAEAAKKAGKFAGIPTSPDRLAEYVDLGYTFFAMGADVIALANLCKDVVKVFEDFKRR